MVGIYLSGTGNTKHCLEKLLSSTRIKRNEKRIEKR